MRHLRSYCQRTCKRGAIPAVVISHRYVRGVEQRVASLNPCIPAVADAQVERAVRVQRSLPCWAYPGGAPLVAPASGTQRLAYSGCSYTTCQQAASNVFYLPAPVPDELGCGYSNAGPSRELIHFASLHVHIRRADVQGTRFEAFVICSAQACVPSGNAGRRSEQAAGARGSSCAHSATVCGLHQVPVYEKMQAR